MRIAKILVKVWLKLSYNLWDTSLFINNLGLDIQGQLLLLTTVPYCLVNLIILEDCRDISKIVKHYCYFDLEKGNQDPRIFCWLDVLLLFKPFGESFMKTNGIVPEIFEVCFLCDTLSTRKIKTNLNVAPQILYRTRVSQSSSILLLLLLLLLLYVHL